MRRKILIIVVAVFFFFPSTGEGFSVGYGEKLFVESSYDYEERDRVDAELQRITNKIYFYVDAEWWNDLEEKERKEYDQIIYNLGTGFEDDYDKITSEFGDKPEHEVTREDRIFVLLHPMRRDAGGYYRTGDQYSQFQYSRSNERNIVYLNTHFIEDPALPGFLGHEFMHLVTFAQKTEKYGKEEEVWLNELRADYMPTFLGHDDAYEGSNLQRRVSSFLRDPDISLAEWTEQSADYGVANLFGQYLVDHYGASLLSTALQSELVGIPSITYALEKEGHDVTFSDVFTDWTIAVYLNDCSVGERYCYKNEHLQDLRVNPTTNFLPFTDKGLLSVDYRTKNWAGNWYRIIGGEGTLHLKFESPDGKVFEVPYILCEKDGDCEIYFFDIDEQGEGEVVVENFNTEYESITLIPSLQQKMKGFNGAESSYLLRWEANIENDKEESAPEETPETKDILRRLVEIRERIRSLRAMISGAEQVSGLSCQRIEKNLYLGMTGSKEVACLQEFLKAQGSHIYPQGLITGNFLEMTRKAVVRFQEEHSKEILAPLGLSQGTGNVMQYTRVFINSLIR